MTNIKRSFNSKIDTETANFILKSDFLPNGDQPNAIKELTYGIKKGEKDQEEKKTNKKEYV